jgi:signal transduction histidine kinase
MAVSPVSRSLESTTAPHEGAADAEAGNRSGVALTAPREPHLRTQLLRRIAHDIASPTGVAATVLDEIAEGATRPELVAMARRSLRRLLRLSDQLALVAELESGSLMPELADTDLRPLVRRALDDALAIDGRKDVVAGCAVPGAAHVRADPRLLVAVLREIIGNGLRAASSRVDVSLEVEGATANILVEDDGPGFTADALEHFGERFLPRSAPRGLGLSLSIAVEVLRDHDATIEVVESRLPPGRRGAPGAGVRISLPLRGDGFSPANENGNRNGNGT